MHRQHPLALAPPAGDSDWLDEISYLDHRANPGGGTVSATFSLAAGAYSLAIGSDPGEVAIHADRTVAMEAGRIRHGDETTP